MKVLMVDPYNYSVEYSINPWMNPQIPVDKKLAIKQWKYLKEKLESLGVEVSVMKSVTNQPDLVFTANAGKVIGNKVILSNFKDKERKGEKILFHRWFKNNGYEVLKLSEELVWEGEACTVDINGIFLASYGYRTDINVYSEVTQYWKPRDIKYVNLVDPYFYHLDVCFCLINKSTALYCPLAFREEDRSWLRSKFKNLIETSLDDALNFACNCIVVGEILLVNSLISDNLEESLRRCSLKVLRIDISEFIKAGGGTKCLVLYL